MIAHFLIWLAPRLIRHDIFGNGGLYLSRHTLLRLGPVRIYLNRIHREDEDAELHNHPWRWAVSWILSGGYTEERKTARGIKVVERRPGRFNFIGANTFHRIDAVEPDCWTLFIVGPRTQDWGFLDDNGVFVPWRTFIAAKGLPLNEPSARKGEG